jgi:hypothetical protein
MIKRHDAATCIYVKLSEIDRLQAIGQAFMEHFLLLKDSVAVHNLPEPFRRGAQTASKTIVLIVDQFEQFYTHHTGGQAGESVVRKLETWYRDDPSLPVKILVVIRGDFLEPLMHLLGAMGASLSPTKNYFALDKFSPAQTARIFRLIAAKRDSPRGGVCKASAGRSRGPYRQIGLAC